MYSCQITMTFFLLISLSAEASYIITDYWQQRHKVLLVNINSLTIIIDSSGKLTLYRYTYKFNINSECFLHLALIVLQPSLSQQDAAAAKSSSSPNTDFGTLISKLEQNFYHYHSRHAKQKFIILVTPC